MKRLFTALAAAFIIGTGSIIAADWAQFARYQASNDSVMKAPADKNRVVFLGNSITDNWAKFTPFFADNGFIGRGISGQTTYQFLVRFRPDVVNLKPALVVINGGTNDVAENTHGYNRARTLDNIRSMVEIAKANGIKVILTSVLPAAQFGWRKTITDAPEKIAELNKAIKAYAAEAGVPYVDYHSAMLATDGRSLRSDYSKDGVHPTPAGYKVMEAIILPAVKKELAR